MGTVLSIFFAIQFLNSTAKCESIPYSEIGFDGLILSTDVDMFAATFLRKTAYTILVASSNVLTAWSSDRIEAKDEPV